MIPQRGGLGCLLRHVPGPSSKGVNPHIFFRNLSSSTPPLPSPEVVEVETGTALPPSAPCVVETSSSTAALPLPQPQPPPLPLPAPSPSPSPEEVKAALAEAKLEAAQSAINYRFKQPGLLWEALQAAGSSATLPEGNKQLAIIGDKLLGFHLALIGRERGEDTSEFRSRLCYWYCYSDSLHLTVVDLLSFLIHCY